MDGEEKVKKKEVITTVLKGLLLSVIMFVLWVVFMGIFTAVMGIETESANQENTGHIMAMMMLTCLINTSIIVYTVLRSRWRGIKLIAVIALQITGIQFFLSFIETVLFNYSLHLPQNLVLSIPLAGLCMAIIFSVIAAALLGRMKETSIEETFNERLGMPWQEFTVKFLLLAAIIYPLLYFLAGYFIAWQFEAIRVFYTGSAEKLSFFAVMGQNLKNSNLYFSQILRGAIWIGIALPVIRMLKGSVQETAAVVGLLFALLMNSQHLVPNPYMSGAVRFAHFIETSSSNFIWGAVVTFLLFRHHSSLGDIFRRKRTAASYTG